MECNKDEALRAKSIAESKLEKKDFGGARKFTLKAQTLYAGLDGISQLLTTLDVYISAENKISGEVDWYGVLGVSPSADDETIRKQYRKFALLLHPDKNKSAGAEGAFKLVSEAWTLLSDKGKRLAYNQRRGSKGFPQKVPMHNGRQPAAPMANGYCKVASRTSSAPVTQNNSVKVPVPPKPTPTPTPTPGHQRTDTFWTICDSCKMHYEYVRTYLNNTLLCPNCKKAFKAIETARPYNCSKPTNQFHQRQHPIHGNHVPIRNAHVPVKNFTSAQKSIPDQSGPTNHHQRRHPSHGNHVPVRNAHDPVKNTTSAQKSMPCQSGPNSFRNVNHHQDSHTGTANVGSTEPSIAAKAANVVQLAQGKLKRAHTESLISSGWEAYTKQRRLDEGVTRSGVNNNSALAHGGFGTSSANAGSSVYGSSGTYHKPNITRELTATETRNMLMAKAQQEIQKKVNHASGNATREDPAVASINVPDPDFHDFDLDRTESSFGDNEVWAAYDNEDGMPRFYALINKVISREQFKLRISWLNSKTNSEFSTLDWIGSGFYKTCGEFRVGKYETCKFINAFSHKVSCSKGLRGAILILPRKGDVWALYKNWSSDWNEQTPDEVIHKYDMVTVLEDYSEDMGVAVAPLVKVVGFKTVFCPNLAPEMIKRIPKEEMFRFSHQVPNHLLSGEEALNAPKDCLELDPAATPLELLQVITETSDAPMKLNKES
ncbi:hypothetical protein F511_20935 [Dorcoceras hygrometricum]|uniref:J domain-containing protein n=1 Tax=Dorcoceras hygrometricum TaxID=472368 RepID=A0A2Z7BEC5_9LAMI|nr:hypothetical protein F511_20935 [Dorcoceras hygrometricum]